MRRKYGVSYKGSKSKIVDKLAEVIPYRGIDNFYDLFAGGCAVTHKMYLEGRYKHYYANDINGQALRLFCDGLKGKYANETRWISREDFFNLKDSDPYVSCCWSFGNNQRDYLYSKIIEPYKKACHYAIVFNDFSLLRQLYPSVSEACEKTLKGITDIHERRIKFRNIVKSRLNDGDNTQFLETSGEMDRLESLERLERLQSLEGSISDYRAVEIKPNSVIYADIPYIATNTYDNTSSVIQPFNHEDFYDWCCKQNELVLISEYYMPEDRFTKVWGTNHVQSLCATKTSSVQECLFVPTRQLEKYNNMMKRSQPCLSLFTNV
nr:MAG TPA: DNA adenine methylase [Caudoviricetes sp.]